MNVVEMLSQAMELPKGKLTGSERLSEIAGWDSLAILSFMVLLDKNCGITLRPEELLRCDSVSDIAALAGSRVQQTQ